jgi:penicillin-binding protein-related factor A (putative recombinase)
MKEKQLQKQIVEFLNYQNCFCWVNNAGFIPVGKGKSKRMVKVGQAGESDIFGIYKKDGRFISFEVKTPKRRSRVTQKQTDWLRSVALYDAYCGLVVSSDEALWILEHGEPGVVYGIDEEINLE